MFGLRFSTTDCYAIQSGKAGKFIASKKGGTDNPSATPTFLWDTAEEAQRYANESTYAVNILEVVEEPKSRWAS